MGPSVPSLGDDTRQFYGVDSKSPQGSSSLIVAERLVLLVLGPNSPRAQTSPKYVPFMYFRAQSRYYLHTWSLGVPEELGIWTLWGRHGTWGPDACQESLLDAPPDRSAFHGALLALLLFKKYWGSGWKPPLEKQGRGFGGFV